MAAQATIISVITDNASELCAAADAVATNVHSVGAPDSESDGSDRTERWHLAKRKPPVYALVPFDPLQALIDAWAARLTGTADDFEVTVGVVGAIELPDYYLVDEDLGDPARAWYFELVYSLSPARVDAFHRTVDGLIAAIRSLRAGRALPDVRTIANQARTFVPGTTGLVVPAERPRIHVM